MMRKRTINKLRMFQTVLEVLKSHQNEWSENPGFAEVVNDIEMAIAAIERMQSLASVNTTGITADKNELIDHIIDLMMEISGSFATLAKRSNNNELHNKVQFTDTELEHLPDVELAKQASTLAQLAVQNADALAKYLITADEIAQLQADADTLSRKINEPRMAVAGRVAANTQLAQLLSSTNLLLKEQMDGLVDRYRRNNPAFWNAYFSARKIIEYGTRHVKKTDTTSVNS